MRTAVRDTSIDAYADITMRGITSGQQQKILRAMHCGRDYSLSELELLTGIAKASICGRVAELRKAGLIEDAPARPCSQTGRRVHPLRLTAIQGVLL